MRGLLRGAQLVLLVVGGVVVGRRRLELGRARVDQLVDGRDPAALAVGAHLAPRAGRRSRPSWWSEKPVALRVAQQRRRSAASSVGRTRAARPRGRRWPCICSRNHGSMRVWLCTALDGPARAAAPRRTRKIRSGPGCARPRRSVVVVERRLRAPPSCRSRSRSGPVSRLRSAFWNASRNVRPMAMRLADALHLRRRARGCASGNFSKLKRGTFVDHVVDRRLEAGLRLPRDVVGELVERVADGQLGGDLRDREPGGLAGERRRARHARVHLDHDHAAVRRGSRANWMLLPPVSTPISRITRDRGVAHHLVLAVGQRLDRARP